MAIEVLIIMLFLVVSIILSLGKGSFLILGFYIKGKEEREKYDEVTLCKFMGKYMFAMTSCLVLFTLSEVLSEPKLCIWAVVLSSLSILFMAIYTKGWVRFKK